MQAAKTKKDRTRRSFDTSTKVFVDRRLLEWRCRLPRPEASLHLIGWASGCLWKDVAGRGMTRGEIPHSNVRSSRQCARRILTWRRPGGT